MSAYLGSIKVWESAPAEWVRPADWLAMPSIAPTEQKIVGLHAVFPTDGNFCAFTISGAFTVDWGDGVVENFSSGATAYHEYSYSDADLNGTISTRGYKQALITITPQSGQNLTSLNFHVKHNQSGLVNGYATGWLDMAISAPNCTSLTFGGTTVRHALTERFVIVAMGSITNLTNAWQNCFSLVSLDLTPLTGAPITNLTNAWQGCLALVSLDLTPLTGAPITNLTGAWFNCFSLVSLDLTPLTGAQITNLTNAWQGCFSLASLDLTPLTGAPITNLTGAWFNCYSLTSLDLTPLTGASITNLTNALSGCSSLAKLIAPTAAITFSVASCKLSAAALNALYTSLPTVTGQTITVTGNYGTSGHTPSIATAKGWTVTV